MIRWQSTCWHYQSRASLAPLRKARIPFCVKTFHVGEFAEKLSIVSSPSQSITSEASAASFVPAANASFPNASSSSPVLVSDICAEIRLPSCLISEEVAASPSSPTLSSSGASVSALRTLTRTRFYCRTIGIGDRLLTQGCRSTDAVRPSVLPLPDQACACGVPAPLPSGTTSTRRPRRLNSGM